MNGGPSRRDVLGRLEAGAGSPDGNTQEPIDRHNVGIKPSAPVSASADVAGMATSVQREIDFGDIGRVVTGKFPEQARERLVQDSRVAYVEQDGLVHSLAETEPWGIDRIDADELHLDGRTGNGVKVAVLDTGIDDDHEDLPTPVAGKCFVSDLNGDGTADCCGQADCTNGNTCNYAWSDDGDHGTHVAGTVAAIDNSAGVIGVATEVDLMAGKVLDGCGSGSMSDVAAGIEWATDNGADVINMSLGGPSGTSTLQNACQYAVDNNVVVVASAGNDGSCTDCVGYPAAYDSVIAVSSTDSDDSLSSFSSTGPEVELAAPGSSVYSTIPPESDGGDGYGTKSGTSMASPHVAGVAALVRGETELSDNTAIRDRLGTMAEDIGLAPEEQGNGLVDAANSVLLVADWQFDTPGRIQYASPETDSTRVFVGGLDDTLYALNRSDGTVDWEFDRAGSLADSTPEVADGVVYVGSGGGTVYALDATDGTITWSDNADSAIVSSPTVASGVVYVGTNDGRLLARDASDGSDVWTFDAGAAIYSKPVVNSGTVFVTTDDGRVLAVDTSTGGSVWTYDTGVELGHSSPAVGDGRVYVAADAVVALDPSTGDQLWQASYGGTAGSSPTYDVTTGQVFVGSDDGYLYALNATDGTEAWTRNLGGSVGSSPVVAGDRVVVGSDSGEVHLADASTGDAPAVRTGLGTVRTAPTVDGDVTFVGAWNGTLHVFRNVS